MANVKFGFGHFNAPTPAGINRAAKIISVALGTILLWINSQNNLFGESATHVINSLGALIIALSNAIAPFFGVDISSATVPTKDVTAIKTE